MSKPLLYHKTPWWSSNHLMHYNSSEFIKSPEHWPLHARPLMHSNILVHSISGLLFSTTPYGKLVPLFQHPTLAHSNVLKDYFYPRSLGEHPSSPGRESRIQNKGGSAAWRAAQAGGNPELITPKWGLLVFAASVRVIGPTGSRTHRVSCQPPPLTFIGFCKIV